MIWSSEPTSAIALDKTLQRNERAPFPGVLCPLPAYRQYQESVDLADFYRQKLDERDLEPQIGSTEVVVFTGAGMLLGFFLGSIVFQGK